MLAQEYLPRNLAKKPDVYPRALEALRLNARSVRGLLAFNLSHACSS